MALIGQRLVPGVAAQRVVAVELMLGTAHIRDLIQRGQFDALREAISRSTEQGLQAFDQHLLNLYERGKISAEEAIRHAESRTDITLKIRLAQGATSLDPQLNVVRDS